MRNRKLGKVILDTDMAYGNDDAIAMFLLSQMDRRGDIELLGVTTTGGNVFAATATTAALVQLEALGRTDIPVFQGTDVPLAGFRDMVRESRAFSMPSFCGAYWDLEKGRLADMAARPTDYHDLGDAAPYGYAHREAEAESAWDFMIEQIRRYPGEVTIMAIGPATNVAHALMKDPGIAEAAKAIYYMGGDIEAPGNATAAAELNWFWDPDAIRLCLGAPWRRQVVVPDDLARQVRWTPDFFDRLKGRRETLVTRFLLSVTRTFESVEAANHVWDPVVPMVFLEPRIATDIQTRYLTVDTSPTPTSGKALSWPAHASGAGLSEGVRQAEIVMGIDEELFWRLVVETLTWQ